MVRWNRSSNRRLSEIYRPSASFRETTANELSRMARSFSSPRRETSWYRSASRVLASDFRRARCSVSISALIRMPSTKNTTSRKTSFGT